MFVEKINWKVIKLHCLNSTYIQILKLMNFMVVMLPHFPKTRNTNHLAINGSKNIEIYATSIDKTNQKRNWKLKKSFIFDVNVMEFCQRNDKDCHKHQYYDNFKDNG